MRLYSDLAPWFHLLTAPADYEAEAERYRRLILAAVPEARTLLELGSGGGNNASHLKDSFACTLSDVSPQMLTLSRELNPECEHILGDMRTLRLGRTFDAVFVHDAIAYMTTESDLRDCVGTAFAHTRPGGVALFVPDFTRETFSPGTAHGGHDGADGRSLRYLEWSVDPDPSDTTYEVDYAVVVREPGQETRVVHDHHLEGLFPEHTWLYLLEQTGLEPAVDRAAPDDDEMSQVVFLGRRPG
ncbi:MAG TPA: class I SAM-dependent methyltransferase [Gaiella sp.]